MILRQRLDILLVRERPFALRFQKDFLTKERHLLVHSAVSAFGGKRRLEQRLAEFDRFLREANRFVEIKNAIADLNAVRNICLASAPISWP